MLIISIFTLARPFFLKPVFVGLAHKARNQILSTPNFSRTQKRSILRRSRPINAPTSYFPPLSITHLCLLLNTSHPIFPVGPSPDKLTGCTTGSVLKYPLPSSLLIPVPLPSPLTRFARILAMPLLPCLPCSSSFPTEHPPPIPTGCDPIHLATSSSDTSSGGGGVGGCSILSSGSADDTISIQTFPSLPTLHNFFPSQNAPATATTASFSLITSLNAPASSQTAPALALSSNYLFSFSQTSIAVYDLTDLRQVLSLPSLSSAGAVKSSALFSPNALSLFTSHQDGKIRLWSTNLPKLRLISSLPTLSDRLRRFPLPSNYVTIRRHRKRLWIEHADAVSAVAVSNNLLYSVSWDKTLKIWRISNLKCIESVTAHDDAVNAVAVGPDGTVYTGSADKKIKVWSKGSGRRHHVLAATLIKHKSAVNALAVSGDGTVLYSGACDRSILVWEREESATFMICSGALRGHVKAIMCLSTVGIDLVVSGSTDRTVRIWRRGGNGEGYSCLCVMEGHVSGVRSVVAEREREEEGYRICSGSLDGEVRVWRVRVDYPKGSDKE